MIRLWGRDTSINVQKVMWLAREIGLEVERIDAGGKFGGLDTAEYGALNPNRRVPVLDDDGFILWESNAIVRYLAATYGGPEIWPADQQARALADQWMTWQVSTLWPVLRVVFIGQIRTPREARDEAEIARQSAQTCTLFQLLDAHLAERAFVAGDHLTLGDIPIGASCYRYKNLDIDRPETPNLDAWYDRLKAREPYAVHVMIEMV